MICTILYDTKFKLLYNNISEMGDACKLFSFKVMVDIVY